MHISLSELLSFHHLFPHIRSPSTDAILILQTDLQRYRATKVKILAEVAQEAQHKLDEARAMMHDASLTSSGGRRTNDCPKQNAERFVRAWERETYRAERAESLAARRPTIELSEVCADGKCDDS